MDAKAKSRTAEHAGQFSKSEKIFFAVCMAVIVGLVAISPYLTDNGPKIISEKLTNAGYSVAGIEFTLIEKGGFWEGGRIYQASAPLEYAAGIYVEQWKVKDVSAGRSTFWFGGHSVTPHPEIPSTVPVNLRLTISQEDYDRIGALANDETGEEYITRLIYERIREGSADE